MMDTRLGLSRIKDNATRSICVATLKELEKIDLILTRFGTVGQIREVVENKLAFTCLIHDSPSENMLLKHCCLKNLAQCISKDADTVHETAFQILSQQFKKRGDVILKILSKYKVTPSGVNRNEALAELTIKHESLNQAIFSTSLIDGYSARVLKAFQSYFHFYNKTMINLWKEIQELEKYHNDIGRYNFAFWALIISFCAFLVSIIGIAFQQFVFWYGNSDVLNVLKDIRAIILSN